MDLFDIAVARKLAGGGGGGGGVTVEPLSVTENATYTAPTGKAYSPVTVNVSGGGGGDFSTAQFNVVNNDTTSAYVLYVANAISVSEDGYYSAHYDMYADPGGTTTATVILFKGQALLNASNIGTRTISISGNIIDVEDGLFIITGDCSLTIS